MKTYKVKLAGKTEISIKAERVYASGDTIRFYLDNGDEEARFQAETVESYYPRKRNKLRPLRSSSPIISALWRLLSASSKP